jgi:hypothetical protein
LGNLSERPRAASSVELNYGDSDEHQLKAIRPAWICVRSDFRVSKRFVRQTGAQGDLRAYIVNLADRSSPALLLSFRLLMSGAGWFGGLRLNSNAQMRKELTKNNRYGEH